MTYPLGMDIRQRAEKLIDVDLDFQDWHGCLHFVEEARCSVHGFWNEFEDQVEVNFIFLFDGHLR